MLILCLEKCNGILELQMEFVKVNDILVSIGGDQVVLQMDGDGRIIPFVDEEWGYSSGCVWSIVVSKLSQEEEQTTVTLFIVGIHMKVLLQGLIDPFSLTITFQMVSGGEMQLHIKGFSQ